MFGLRNLRNPSAMSHDFSKIPHADIPRSAFKRSHTHKTTFDAGYLIPIYVDEVLPGDTFKLNLSAVSRLNTPLFPIMDNMHLDYFFFFVPNRLLWTNWERFLGHKDNPTDSTDYLVPQIGDAYGWTDDSLADYFGIPVGIPNLFVNSLHFRAYNLIWNQWFRDENLQDSVVVDLGDGPDDPTDYVLLKRGKRHDYFTSCLPWPQKGPGVDLPLGESAPVLGIGKATQAYNTGPFDVYETGGSGMTAYAKYLNSTGSSVLDQFAIEEDPNNAGYPGIYADLSNATAASINSLREAFQLQRLMERDARGGTRYTEIIQSHFRVTSPDFRLQRPEYLGGGSKPVIVEPVPSTADTASFNVGDLAAHGYQAFSGVGFTKSFVEHGVIIGLVMARADLTYQKGLNRMWSRQTKYDFYWPALAHLGEQEVLNKEIYLQGTSADDDVFGYQERWAEYRYHPAVLTSRMRSDHAVPLDAWHLSQDFASLPVLNSSFIEEDPPVDRVIGVPSEPHFKMDAFFDVTCTRPMPMYSVPGLIDHF